MTQEEDCGGRARAGADESAAVGEALGAEAHGAGMAHEKQEEGQRHSSDDPVRSRDLRRTQAVALSCRMRLLAAGRASGRGEACGR